MKGMTGSLTSKDITRTWMGYRSFRLRFRRGLEIEVDELFFIGEGEAKGMEFLLQKKQGRYTGWASYTLGRVRHTFPGINDGQEFPPCTTSGMSSNGSQY